jgi:hypothetical protein
MVVAEPDEWLTRYSDWRKCQRRNPRRQAYELIKPMAWQQKRERA